MYLVPTKAVVSEALETVFDGSYPEPDFRSVNVTLNFPIKEQDYPGIWVQFEDNQDMQRAGINHAEYIIDNNGINRAVTRWRFGGVFHFTVSAFSSQERDRLFDEVVRVIAFTNLDTTPAGRFKQLIEDNDLIGINLNYDVITPSGDAANPGTPWGTDAVIYERTLSIAMIGEFISDLKSNQLYNLSRIDVRGYIEGNDNGGIPDISYSQSEPWDPSQWT